eukprot:scaffold2933_cov31-Tisochrysis_lutea.AAC.4
MAAYRLLLCDALRIGQCFAPQPCSQSGGQPQVEPPGSSSSAQNHHRRAPSQSRRVRRPRPFPRFELSPRRRKSIVKQLARRSDPDQLIGTNRPFRFDGPFENKRFVSGGGARRPAARAMRGARRSRMRCCGR